MKLNKKILYYIFACLLLIASLTYFLARNGERIFERNVKKADVIKDTYSKIYNKLYPTSDIDLVYTWVDGNDPEWQKEKVKWAKVYGVESNIVNNKARFIDSGELKYSLRSAEKYVPWINKIYIVTNGQIPEWLNLDNPKIEIVTHDQIMPKSALPTFNSMAIEANIAHIPNLSEKFLYSNDDTFFGRPLTPGFFYTKGGKTKVIVDEVYEKDANILTPFIRQIQYSFNLLYKDDPNKKEFYVFAHQITPYLKSYYLEAEKSFPKEFNWVTHAKFRTDGTVQIFMISYYTEKNGKTVYIFPKVQKDLNIGVNHMGLVRSEMERIRPYLFCLNDTENTTDADRLEMKLLLEELFPEKSSFEK